jgi:hypothetical protein
MGSLLTSISGQFGKAILLGTLFPVLIFCVLAQLIIVPVLPFAQTLNFQFQRIALGEDKVVAVGVVFIIIVITGTLYNLNIPIIRLYEGYPWKDSLFGNLVLRRIRKNFEEITSLRIAMRNLKSTLAEIDPESNVLTSLQVRQNALATYINSELPDKVDNLLPTRLGNVIRNFERYSAVSYAMDAIVLWPRLISKIDQAFASTIDDSKTSFDFMLNNSFLCGMGGITLGVVGLFSKVAASGPLANEYLWRIAVFLGLSVVFYNFSIGRAAAWGQQVKSAFDLYRTDLLNSLGYSYKPATSVEERALWQDITRQLYYPDTRDNSLHYRGPATRIVVDPRAAQIEFNRKMNSSAVLGNWEVVVVLTNVGKKAANCVTIYESLPDGFKLLPGSLSISKGADLTISNFAPLEFAVANVSAGAQIDITYLIKAS